MANPWVALLGSAASQARVGAWAWTCWLRSRPALRRAGRATTSTTTITTTTTVTSTTNNKLLILFLPSLLSLLIISGEKHFQVIEAHVQVILSVLLRYKVYFELLKEIVIHG